MSWSTPRKPEGWPIAQCPAATFCIIRSKALALIPQGRLGRQLFLRCLQYRNPTAACHQSLFPPFIGAQTCRGTHPHQSKVPEAPAQQLMQQCPKRIAQTLSSSIRTDGFYRLGSPSGLLPRTSQILGRSSKSMQSPCASVSFLSGSRGDRSGSPPTAAAWLSSVEHRDTAWGGRRH